METKVVDTKQFVSDWMEVVDKTLTLEDMAARHGVDVRKLYQKASRLRKVGVNLPKLKEPTEYYSVPELNEMIASHRTEAKAKGIKRFFKSKAKSE